MPTEKRLSTIEDLAARIAARAMAVRELEGAVGRMAQVEAGRMVDECSDLWTAATGVFDQLVKRGGGTLGPGTRPRKRKLVMSRSA